MNDENSNRTVTLATNDTGELATTEQFPWGVPGCFDPVPAYKGAYRGDRTVLTVSTDVEAVASWLAETANKSPNTADRYRREVERLLLWASSRHKCLSDLGREDFLEFAEFIKNPSPARSWVMEVRYRRSSPLWRPFLGPMGDNSRHQALVVIYSLMRHLADTGWLYANPMPRPSTPAESRKVKERDDLQALTLRQEGWLRAAVERIQDSLDRARMRWVVEMLLGVGPRTSEIVNGVMTDVALTDVNGTNVWVLRVTGKGNKRRKLPLKPAMVAAFKEFRRALGLPSLPESNEPPYPLFPHIRGFRAGPDGAWKAGSRNALYKRLQGVFEASSLLAEAQGIASPEIAMECELDAAALKRCTTHDLRHTALKRLADETGGDMRLVQLMAGHDSIQTSSIYTRSAFADLVEAIAQNERRVGIPDLD